MKREILFLFAMVVELTSSCSTVTDIDVGLDNPKYVLNALLTSDSSWHVSLTKSNNIRDNQYYFDSVNDAVVEIYDQNNVLVETLAPSTSHPYSGQYDGAMKPNEGEQYTIKARVAGEPVLLAGTDIPQTVPIISYEIDSTSESNDNRVQMTISIQDPAGENNYYLIKVLRDMYSIFNGDTVRFKEDAGYELIDPSYEENNMLALNDNLFDGRMHKFDFRIYPSGWSAETEHLRVLLLSISQEYYMYLTTIDLQQSVDGDPFAQPTPIFSNIENGLGIFAGYNSSVITLK